MELSEAIRKGCDYSERCEGQFVDVFQAGPVRACALGAAWLAGVENPYEITAAEAGMVDGFLMRSLYPVLDTPILPGCTCSAKALEDGHATGRQYTLFHSIIHLNDDHRWDRDRIADWLESVGY